MHMEVGHAARNVCLFAGGLAGARDCGCGAFDDEWALCIMPVGRVGIGWDFSLSLKYPFLFAFEARQSEYTN